MTNMIKSQNSRVKLTNSHILCLELISIVYTKLFLGILCYTHITEPTSVLTVAYFAEGSDNENLDTIRDPVWTINKPPLPSANHASISL